VERSGLVHLERKKVKVGRWFVGQKLETGSLAVDLWACGRNNETQRHDLENVNSLFSQSTLLI
jgi:hypothetical protein